MYMLFIETYNVDLNELNKNIKTTTKNQTSKK